MKSTLSLCKLWADSTAVSVNHVDYWRYESDLVFIRLPLGRRVVCICILTWLVLCDMDIENLEAKMMWLKNFERIQEIQQQVIWQPITETEPRAFIPEVCLCSVVSCKEKNITFNLIPLNVNVYITSFNLVLSFTTFLLVFICVSFVFLNFRWQNMKINHLLCCIACC